MGFQIPPEELLDAVPVLQALSPDHTYGPTYSLGTSPSDPQYATDKYVSGPPAVMPENVTRRPAPSYNDGEAVDWTGSIAMEPGSGDLLVGFKVPVIPRSTQGTGYIMRQIFQNGDVSSQFIWQSPRIPTGGGRTALVFGRGVGSG
jgi:hypothetical protein